MTKQLKFTSLLLLVTSITFAQQNVITQARTTSNVIPGVGTVVKKNPGGGASRVGTTNDKGEVQLTIKEAGNYTLTLIKTSTTEVARTEGVPVVGTLVKCGKNPSGLSLVIGNTNDKGEVELKNMAVGNYTIIVQQGDKAINTTKPTQN